MITREEEEGFIVSSRPSSSSSSTSTSTATISSWSRSKDLRIVRVSKAFGGKDRHSKVCTVRGLRDRRVRLSVETAIQIYDLQERLGLNQPSKVVDWLLNEAKHEIDQLPPLQIPPHGLNFSQNLHYSMPMAATKRDHDEQSKEIIKDEKSRNEEMGNLNLDHHQHGVYASLSTSELLQKPSNNNPCLVQGLVNQNSLAYNNSSPFLRWGPSNLSLSHQQPEDNGDHQQFQNFNNNSTVPLQPSTLFNNNITPSGSQVVLYPPFGVPNPQSCFDLQMWSSNSHNPFSPSSISQRHVESSTHHHQHQHQHQQEAAPSVRPFQVSVTTNTNETNKADEYDSR